MVAGGRGRLSYYPSSKHVAPKYIAWQSNGGCLADAAGKSVSIMSCPSAHLLKSSILYRCSRAANQVNEEGATQVPKQIHYPVSLSSTRHCCLVLASSHQPAQLLPFALESSPAQCSPKPPTYSPVKAASISSATSTMPLGPPARRPSSSSSTRAVSSRAPGRTYRRGSSKSVHRRVPDHP